MTVEAQECPRCGRRYRSRYGCNNQGNRVCWTNYNIAYQVEARRRCIDHYGGACACCGETARAFLTIDHVNGNGAEHRRSIMGSKLFIWLQARKYPEGFQVLCYNCNCAKSDKSHCPGRDTVCAERKVMMNGFPRKDA